MDLPVPEGQKKDKSFASHSTMSKSFGLQRKTLARVIGLEKRVDKIESGSGGINIDKFTELNKGIVSVNNNLKAIGDALTAELVADKEAARDEKNKNKREVDALKKGKAEKFLELEETKKVVKPVEKVKETAKTIFQRLFDALSMVFAGWLLDKGGKMLNAWGEGDMETFNKMKDEIVKSLAVVGGLLLAVNLVGIIGSMKLIVAGLKIGIPAVLGLLANPWTWVVLGIGVAAYFGYKALDKSITGGGEFKTFDENLRAGTEEGGLDVKNFGTGALFLDPKTKKPIRVKMWEGDTGAAGDDKWGSLMGRPFVAGKDSGKNMSAEMNIINPLHRKWIAENFGEEALANADKRYQSYQNVMALKKEMVKKMKNDLHEAEMKIRSERAPGLSKISEEDEYLESPGAHQYMKETGDLVKKSELEIRAHYDKQIQLRFPELFDEDVNTLPVLSDKEKKYLWEKKEDGTMKLFHNPNFVDYSPTHGNQWWDFLDVKEDRKREIPPSLRETTINKNNTLESNTSDTGIDFKTAVELGSQVNNEKISSISSTLLDSDNNFEFVPFEQGMNTDTDFGSDMNLGDASEIPSLYTANIGNEYRFFYSHVYQQGND